MTGADFRCRTEANVRMLGVVFTPLREAPQDAFASSLFSMPLPTGHMIGGRDIKGHGRKGSETLQQSTRLARYLWYRAYVSKTDQKLD